MQKSKLKIIWLGLFLLGGLAVFLFYQKHLSGIWPAIQNPAEDITKSENTTGLPLKLPAGYSISIFAKGLVNPRVMTYGPNGMLVSEMSAGRVSYLADEDTDGDIDQIVPIISGLNNPHGIALKCEPKENGTTETFEENCKIYIAETHRVVEYDYDAVNNKAVNGRKVVDLPADGGHSSRTLLFMPYADENKLLISVGSSCNICTEKDSRRAKILQYDVKTGKLTDFARGLRNSVFMAIHPVTGKIWATEMGRDLLGDDIPPDEINIINGPSASSGQNSAVPNFGWPICYGKNIVDISISSNKVSCEGMAPSHIDLQAHSAPLGLAFIPEEGWAEDYWYNLLVSYHGSWNRSVPTGYKVVRIRLDANGKVLSEPEDFITGWLANPSAGAGALGRPVDIIVQPGGTIYISDDKAGVIYRVIKN